MNSYTADKSLQHSLSLLPGLTVVRDSAGSVLGYFSPASHKLPEAYAQAAANFDPVEMQQRKESGERGRTTNEVIRRMTSQQQ